MSTNVEQKLSIIQKLDATAPAQIVSLPEVADRFRNLYSLMNGKNADMANVAYESEKFHFMKLLQDKPELQKCTKLSLYGCFLDMAVQGLSFDPAMKHAYVVGFPHNVGTKDNPKWETRAALLIDGRGELLIRTRQGQIKYADNPVVVWSCDYYKSGLRSGKKFVEHESVHPRPKDAEIIACYLVITRADGSVDYSVMDIEDVNDLREFSKQKNSLAWTAGLKGMVETKTIKHAFKSYPKVKLGSFTQLKSEAIEPENTEFKIDYGLNGSMPQSNLPENAAQFTQAEVVNTAPTKEEIHKDEFMNEKVQEKPEATGRRFDDEEF